MRTITLIVIHCSATRENREYSFEACKADHVVNRHFTDIGYHYYITRDGKIHNGRSEERNGAHCRGHNSHSIGICYEGGLDSHGNPADTRTPAQRATLAALIRSLKEDYPRALVVGHRDLDPLKQCPCFDAATEYKNL
ncbi:MAG: N-acetylmuramoyl-L-alanine amidase [Prevotella sp.]|nr:N-acetylmuramoyl-L-alanine amidase [Prevotella sp.]MBQ8702301.1 N-acetylmuramoyl-L-alanine amidase [Prevotella sp.]